MTPEPDDADHLRMLRELRKLGTAPEAQFDALVRLVSRQLACPVAWLGLQNHLGDLWVKAEIGLTPDGPPGSATVLMNALLEPDARKLVTDTHSAAAYIIVNECVVGQLCAAHHAAHTFSDDDLANLRDLAELASSLLDTQLKEWRWRMHSERVRVASLSSSDWLWESDAAGCVTWVSSGVELHTGKTPGQIIGRTLAQINLPHEGDPSDSWQRYQEARAQRAPFRDVIAERETPNGLITVSVSGVPVFSSDGVFRGYRGTTSNITERMQAQKAASKAERLLNDALDSLTAGVMITDPSGKVVMANAVWRRRVGHYMDDGASWPQIVERMAHAGDYPSAQDREAFVRWRLGLASHTGEHHEIRWKDRWIIVSDQLLADGSAIHLSVDITDRKLAELTLAEQGQQLRESQAQLSAVLEAVPDLWFVFDANGNYLKCSSENHPMMVHSWESVRGKPFGAGVPQPVADLAVPAIKRALATGEVQRIDYELATPDGVMRTFEARLSPMPNEQVLYVTRDLTELRHLERDVLIMQRALEADASLPMSVADATQPDMPLIYVNPSFERLTGYSRREVLGSNCRFLLGQFTEQPGRAQLRDAVREGRAASVTLTNVRKDGTVFSNALHVAPVRDAAGRLTHYIGVQRDVTEQSRAADKLRLSEELYRSVAAAISDGLLVVTPTLDIIAINPAGCDILGVNQADVVGLGDAWPFALLGLDQSLLAADDHPVKRVVSKDQPLIGQTFALRRPDGQTRWISLNGHPLQLRPEGSTFSVVLTFRDITQQRAAEQALAMAEERWKFALEGSGDGLWDWDGRTDKFYYSTRWKEMRGFADHEIGDTPDEWRSRVHPDDLPRVMAAIRSHHRGEVPYYDLEYRVRHRLGHDIWVRDRGKIVRRGADGRADRIVGTQSDVTRRKQDDQMLRDKQAAELANQAKSEFLSRMSHEMRTPLNAVIGFSQLLGMNPAALDAGTVREYAGHVLGAGEHLLALIDDVLDLQKIEDGALALDLGAVDLHDVVLRAIELLWPTAQARQVSLRNEVGPGAWVHADVQRLRQVLLNVGSNAIKYNRVGGGVQWRLENPAPGRLTLCVEDNGTGMSAEQMSRLFQPFERLGRETSAIEGTGLGLIISRSLVQAIGGRLEVSSEAGRGTCVRIQLQSVDAPSDAAMSASATTAVTDAPESNGLRMLYVEDNRLNAILFEEAMRMHSSRIELRVAEDGDQAVSLAQDWQPEVLVLDAHLPGISGFEVLRMLRTLPGLDNVPAYMCSADAMPDDMKRAYEAGFIGYWTKPINVSSVLADIEECMRRGR
ncbi:MAG: PAS domain S-box protein [Rhizobacter sp.]|nr:PAS domain S-box protein [Rhizobacter sp.]